VSELKTKIFRVYLAGGVALDVLAPVGTVVDLDFTVKRALELAARYFVLAHAPLVMKINAAQTLPGDVAFHVAPRVKPPAQRAVQRKRSQRSQPRRW
jgi:hypothetical protein